MPTFDVVSSHFFHFFSLFAGPPRTPTGPVWEASGALFSLLGIPGAVLTLFLGNPIPAKPKKRTRFYGNRGETAKKSAGFLKIWAVFIKICTVSPRFGTFGARFGTFGRPPRSVLNRTGPPFWHFWEPFCLVVAQTEAKSKENAYLDCVSRHVFGVWPKSGLISGEIEGFLPDLATRRSPCTLQLFVWLIKPVPYICPLFYTKRVLGGFYGNRGQI